MRVEEAACLGFNRVKRKQIQKAWCIHKTRLADLRTTTVEIEECCKTLIIAVFFALGLSTRDSGAQNTTLGHPTECWDRHNITGEYS